MISVLLLRNKSKLTEQAALRLGQEMPSIIAAASADDGPHAAITKNDVTVSMVTTEEEPSGDSAVCVLVMMLPRVLCAERVRAFIQDRIAKLDLAGFTKGMALIRLSPG